MSSRSIIVRKLNLASSSPLDQGLPLSKSKAPAWVVLIRAGVASDRELPCGSWRGYQAITEHNARSVGASVVTYVSD